MLDKIKKYAPKTHELLQKIITTKENAKLKIADYEKRIQLLDKEISDLEVKSIKDPSNSNLNDKLEELSAKRYGLKSRYEAIKNNELNLFSKEEIDKLFDVYCKEHKEKISKKQNEVSIMYRELTEERMKKQKELEESFGKRFTEIQMDEYAIKDVSEVLSHTVTKHLLMNNMTLKEVEELMLQNGLPFDAKTIRSL